MRRQKVPVIGAGQGASSFVHIEDAASATIAALECVPGVYNIVDGDPSKLRVWLPAFARACVAPEPLQITEQEALATSGADSGYYTTRLRGAANEKAGYELNFRPRALEWLGREPSLWRPIVRSTRFEPVINLKTAKVAWLDLRPAFYWRADEPIEEAPKCAACGCRLLAHGRHTSASTVSVGG